jgi:HK97 family phage portal protein
MSPNPYMTPTTFWTTTEMNCQHYGNAFIWMRTGIEGRKKYGGTFRTYDAWPLQPQNVTVLMDDGGYFGKQGAIYYQYTDPKTSMIYIFRSDEVLHFKTWFSADGILGKSVREILKATIEGASNAQTYMNSLYASGLSQTVILQYAGDLDKTRREAIKKKFADDLKGKGIAGRVIPIPVGLTVQPIKMSMAEAEFAQLRKYTALQIAGAFGVKPDQINNLEKSSYTSSEAQQLSFLVDTVAVRLKMYEEEINRKALTTQQIKDGYYYKFNEKAALRTDSNTQMEILTKAVSNGVYTANEAREKIDLPARDGGDELIVNGSMVRLADVGKQYGIEGGGRDG